MADTETTADPSSDEDETSGTSGKGSGAPGGDAKRPVTPPWQPPPGARSTMQWAPDGHDPLAMTASAGWTVLRRDESPSAEVFAVSYVVEDAADDRPVTFVFNGGPGASSAYLHVGAVGPRRVVLPDDGSLPRMPISMADNEASWLPHSDLVFIDPVGTGFSRRIPDDKDDKQAGSGDAESGKSYWTYEQDLAAMREFIGRWLSGNGRWAAPVFIAGESYGGYRVGRLARSLQQDEGVGLVGAVLISPAIEITPLTFTDYAADPFVDTVPTMAAGALHHGRSRVVDGDADVDEVMAAAAEFATGEYATFLVRGDAMEESRRDEVLARLGDFIGLSPDTVERLRGRVGIERWVREILRDEGLVAGLYDVTQTVVDPFPDRTDFEGGDPTLAGATPAFTMAVNHVLRSEIGLGTERRYDVLSMKVNTKWRADEERHALENPPGATDDLRNGLTLNPHLQVLIVHGRHDLVTPLQASRRLVDLMRLHPDVAERVDLRAYDGGHMFYSVAASRDAFAADIADFYRRCLAD